MLQKIKTALGNVGCKVGFHDFEWNYVSVDSCVQLGKCRRKNCNGTKERTNHNWGKWAYIDSKSCLQERPCSRCHIKDEQIEHTWGAWQYEREGACQKISSCQRCNEIQTGDIEHIWNPYQYESETSCHQIAYCRRCDEINHHPDDFSHNWSDWIKDYPTGRWKKRCTHCGSEELGSLFPPEKPRIVNYHKPIINNPTSTTQYFTDNSNNNVVPKNNLNKPNKKPRIK